LTKLINKENNFWWNAKRVIKMIYIKNLKNDLKMKTNEKMKSSLKLKNLSLNIKMQSRTN